MDLGLQVFEQRGWQVVLVSGELDVATAPRLHEQLVRAREPGPPAHRDRPRRRDDVRLDGPRRGPRCVGPRARALGGELVLISPPAAVRELLELTEIEAVIPIHASLDTVPA